jgi:hypothetical protein
MGVIRDQAGPKPYYKRHLSKRFPKQQLSRYRRREAKRDPENAVRKRASYSGYYW